MVRVGGLDKDKIVQEAQRLLEDQTLYKKMSKAAQIPMQWKSNKES